MKKVFLSMAVWMILFSIPGYSQEQPQSDVYGADKMNSIHLELLGPGGLVSLHYERMVNKALGLRGGLGYLKGDKAEWMSVPVFLTCLVENGVGYYELGIGGVYLDTSGTTDDFFGSNDQEIMGAVFIGYRYEDKGIIIRAGFVPVFDKDGFYPLGTLSWGFPFGLKGLGDR